MRYTFSRFVPLVILGLLACGAAPRELASASASADTFAPAEITFSASWAEAATPLVAGEVAELSYDPARLPSCRGSLGYGGGGPGWSIDAGYAMNGINFEQTVGIAGLGLSNAPLGPGELPTLALPFAGTLELWFENDDAFGCNAWDSAYGANYRFPVAPPANAPGWVGNASVLVDRATCGPSAGPCYADAQPADRGATFDTWARQRAAITQMFFDAWKSGVTDFDNPSLWQELDVESHHRFGPSAAFVTDYVSFATRTGNNARYAANLRPLDPFGGIDGSALATASQCPAIPATTTADGQYVQVDLEIYFTVNGVAVQPNAGGTFHVLYRDYAGLYAVCAYPKAP